MPAASRDGTGLASCWVVDRAKGPAGGLLSSALATGAGNPVHLHTASVRGYTQVVRLSDVGAAFEDRVYRVDVRGFLVDPADWDEAFAANKAYEMKMPEGLSEPHWRIVRFLREAYQKTGQVARVYDACEENGIDLAELERLFPDGYHRGAVKLAGLRVR